MVESSERSGARPRRLWLLAPVLLAAAGGAWWSAHRRAAEPVPSVALGSGRAQLLDFGMGICEQCKKLKPVMERASRELGSKVDVHVLDIRQEANERLAERFRMTAIPLVVLVDGAGNELWRHEGFVDFPELSHAVADRLRPGATRAPER